ncbi:flagellar biosynthesis protein [Paenibacillus darwinianus]|uniref:Flagellar biosynthesis protein n=1 Tax=Paenibacillus darwinianus TaxID=1380763 RepID=A0A9W5S341_9BACL|nr:TIGR02530 family flagellar biosynthesis protein [Paenibacillus darwinianus]EXX91332.1 flagellar biosynthesis protein [Paenibacillus darwinianus]EXX92295.1 flagellar biosynthesis protein [Paenibacillus darwinianus]EXX92832.1 flagellar biosynthesis protein [Paenibacillus darwinianus]
MSDSVRVGQMYSAVAAPIGLRKTPSADAAAPQSVKFEDLLQASQLKFSRHAEVRMQQRGISFMPEQVGQIMNAIRQAEAKGAKDSLVLYRDIAMIVNVPSKTVVTAMDGKSAWGNVFTQIDSAVVIS